MFRSFIIPLTASFWVAGQLLAFAGPDETYASLEQPAALLNPLSAPVGVADSEATDVAPSPVKEPAHSHKTRRTNEAIPSWQQDLSSLRSLPNASMEMLEKAYRIVLKQKRRRLVLLDYRFADTNGDGTYEVVTLSFAPDAHDRTRFIVGVYDFDEHGEPVLRFEKKQRQTAPYEPGNFSQSIDAIERGFTLCENWRLQTWQIHECHDLRLDHDWNPKVLQHTVETVELSTHATQINRFDFQYGTASRAYTRLPDGPFMPALQRKTDYAMIFSSSNDALLPEPVSLKTTQIAEMTPHDALRVGSAWNAAGIYLTIEAADSDIFEPESCSDTLSVQQYDHAEFWFDLNPALENQPKSPETWQIEYQKHYHNEPYRHHADENVFGIAVTPNMCVVPLTPGREHWRVMPQIKTTRRAAGYSVDIFIPAAFYGVSSMNSLGRAQGLSFTARQHDRHGVNQFDQTATSTFEWPDPFTFGQIWLTTPNTAFPPPFPMQWDSWLDNH